MALISQSDIEARIGRSLTSAEATSFTAVNAATQAFVERIVGSGIEAVSATTRYYDGGVQHLAIDPCTDITAVLYVDEDNNTDLTLDISDYTTEPVNDTMKTMIRHRVRIPSGINNLAVTAKFSINADAKVLAIVKEAIIELNRLQINSNADVASESIEGYSVNYTNLTTLANNYKSHPAIAPLYYLFPGI